MKRETATAVSRRSNARGTGSPGAATVTSVPWKVDDRRARRAGVATATPVAGRPAELRVHEAGPVRPQPLGHLRRRSARCPDRPRSTVERPAGERRRRADEEPLVGRERVRVAALDRQRPDPRLGAGALELLERVGDEALRELPVVVDDVADDHGAASTGSVEDAAVELERVEPLALARRRPARR